MKLDGEKCRNLTIHCLWWGSVVARFWVCIKSAVHALCTAGTGLPATGTGSAGTAYYKRTFCLPQEAPNSAISLSSLCRGRILLKTC